MIRFQKRCVLSIRGPCYPALHDSWGGNGSVFRLFASFCESGKLADRVGFEPTEPGGSTVFKTVAFNRSATCPDAEVCLLLDKKDCRRAVKNVGGAGGIRTLGTSFARTFL